MSRIIHNNRKRGPEFNKDFSIPKKQFKEVCQNQNNTEYQRSESLNNAYDDYQPNFQRYGSQGPPNTFHQSNNFHNNTSYPPSDYDNFGNYPPPDILFDQRFRGSQHFQQDAAAVQNHHKEEDNDPNYFHCDVCDLPLTGRLDAESHYMGNNHHKALAGKAPGGKEHYDGEGYWIRIAPSVPSEQDNFGTDFAQGDDSTNDKEIKGRNLQCELCGVCVKSEQQMAMHVSGQQHKKKVEQQVKEKEDENKIGEGPHIGPIRENVTSGLPTRKKKRKGRARTYIRLPNGKRVMMPRDDAIRCGTMEEVVKEAERRYQDKLQKQERADTLKAEATRRGEYEKALLVYDKAIEHIKDSCMLYINRALTQINLQRYEKAIEDAENAVKLNENSLKAGLLRSRTFSRGHFGAAVSPRPFNRRPTWTQGH